MCLVIEHPDEYLNTITMVSEANNTTTHLIRKKVDLHLPETINTLRRWHLTRRSESSMYFYNNYHASIETSKASNTTAFYQPFGSMMDNYLDNPGGPNTAALASVHSVIINDD